MESQMPISDGRPSIMMETLIYFPQNQGILHGFKTMPVLLIPSIKFLLLLLAYSMAAVDLDNDGELTLL
ncbi:MAG: hypothetical protein R2788_21270 [Saprospiraceae bacterium]